MLHSVHAGENFPHDPANGDAMTNTVTTAVEQPSTSKLPYEAPRLTRKKSVAKATLFSGSGTIVGGGVGP